MIKLKQIITESIKLPADKIIVLQADTDEHKRGLVVKWRSDGGYDVAYWYDTPDNIVAAEVRTAEELPDGKWEEHGEGLGDYKHVWLGYHPKLDERLKKGESGCCHKCGWSHVKGSAHKTPYKSGKNSCANRKSESLSEGCGCGCNTCVKVNEYNLIEYLKKQTIQEGEYEGRDVKLNKPMQGDVKKFKVYVKNSKGNVVKVNFGQKGMVIKKDNPGARKSFRARHKCDQKKDKTTAGYWSCKKW